VSSARFAEMVAKKSSAFPSTKPLNSGFIRITRKRLAQVFALSGSIYENFENRLASPKDTNDPSAYIAQTLNPVRTRLRGFLHVLADCWT